ncbi:hypothetical protein GOP47_0027153 [Adiantum capillus-veneris]|nr:hypothetical protein GOP47_0027153 [Adiantum capillus-veneris]
MTCESNNPKLLALKPKKPEAETEAETLAITGPKGQFKQTKPATKKHGLGFVTAEASATPIKKQSLSKEYCDQHGKANRMHL